MQCPRSDIISQRPIDGHALVDVIKVCYLFSHQSGMRVSLYHRHTSNSGQQANNIMYLTGGVRLIEGT